MITLEGFTLIWTGKVGDQVKLLPHTGVAIIANPDHPPYMVDLKTGKVVDETWEPSR